ncbi:GyrI-like domain-containing protein [Aquimarina gracilis]|uniref:GyrI-like domain-containing protein n=1 Tax=Aquimarina gracilis TaxID=874422 RepID=A0ABU5ZS15_9FLAO|nr:GyrI-like domain-containing protein [Aquimarina gracilis]MEB3344586.1 GyrI-like domain-containing protein [Aquimarina gracilis]
MKIIKYLFFLLLLVVIGGAVYVATIDGEFQVEESRVIEAPDELLFNTINEYKTWEKWGPWMDESDDLIMEYATQTSGEGASYSWKSEIQGDGKMKTLKAVPFASIDQKITFVTPMGESNSDVYWKFEKIEGKKTKVTWGMKGKQSFMEKAFWATQDSTVSQMLRPMYQRGLEKLDNYTKEAMSKYTINVDGATEYGGGFYMYSATASSIAAIPEKMAQMLPAVNSYMRENNLPQTGMPFTIYNNYNEEQGTAIFSSAIPTRDKVVTPKDSDILCDFLPKQKAVKTTLKGDYINLKEAWEAGYKYIADNGLEAEEKSPAFEVYRVDPGLQPNPAEWVTEIYIPIK